MFLTAVKKLLIPNKRRAPRRPPSHRRLDLECLEGREVPAVIGPVAATLAPALSAPTTLAATSSLSDKMANFLGGKLGQRVGGGECAHLATEALRVAGADFTRTEPNGTQDYVWTSNRVARLTNGSQLAGKMFKVGDIIQYNGATFSSGGASKLNHHTQVVAAVDTSGRITQVYEQNFNNNRSVQKRAVPDLSKLNGGSVSIYRPVARINQAGLTEFTIVNNTKSNKTYTLQFGSSISNKTLTKANTAGSYIFSWVQTTGNTAVKVSVGSVSVTVTNGAAYELYTMSNGNTGIRKI